MAGFVDDFSVVNGVETDMGTQDSTDAYAGGFLAALRAMTVATGDTFALRDRCGPVTGVPASLYFESSGTSRAVGRAVATASTDSAVPSTLRLPAGADGQRRSVRRLAEEDAPTATTPWYLRRTAGPGRWSIQSLPNARLKETDVPS